jgi:hypothetical protein
MKLTNEINSKIEDILNGLNIQFTIEDNFIMVDRTSMVQNAGLNDENACYNFILELIKINFDEKIYFISWSGKSDDWYGIDVYIK